MTPENGRVSNETDLTPKSPTVSVRPAAPWHEGAATFLIMLASALVSLAFWLKKDVSFLFLDYHVFQGQIWRLFTSALVHANIFHLAFNLYWLHRFLPYYERALGGWRSVIALAFWAAIPGAAEYAFLDGGIGLSGIVYGAFGFLWWLGRHDARYFKAVTPQTTKLFVGWFFLCIILTVTNVMPIGNIAHGVGALCGVATGWVYFAAGSRQWCRAIAVGAGATVILLLASVGRPLVNMSPNRWHELASRGYDAHAAGHLDEAITLYRRALAIHPESDWAWHNLGRALADLHRGDEAEEALQRAHDLDKGSREIKQELAVAKTIHAIKLLQRDQNEEALPLLRRALELDNQSANGWYNLGVALDRLDRHAEALEAFKTASKLAPEIELYKRAAEHAP
ncbi:MAG: rhomboid family intramembrane serine protease [Gemmataceae bacterium]